MELGGKLLNSLRIKTQFIERLQSVSVVDGAIHTQKDDVESNGGSLDNVAEIFVLFLCGVQLVLRSGVFTILDLDEVDVTPRFAEVLGSVRSGVNGSAGGWRCCFCVFASIGVTSTKAGRLDVNLSLSEKQGGKSHLRTILLSAVLGTGDFAWSSARCCLCSGFANHKNIL